MTQDILEKLNTKTAVIGVVGMGYVGQPLALRFAQVGFQVLGFDINAQTVAGFNAGRSAIEHIDDTDVAAAVAAGLACTTDFARISEVDAIILCVPTPLNKYREPDLSFVTSTCEAIVPYLRKGQVISLESTTYPGTTEEEILPRVTRNGLRVGEDIFVVYSPEREDPGNETFTTDMIPKIVGGHTAACLQVGTALYAPAINQVVPVSSTQVAEMVKLVENIQRAVNIALVNEMKLLTDRMGIDIFEVIDAAATKPFGFAPYYPGPGLGGHCIPIDPFYLTWKAREYGLHTRFIELSGEINNAMPGYVFGKLVSALNAAGKALKGARILMLGIAYKKNVDDMRESPAVQVMDLIRDSGGVLSYSDPHVPVFPQMRKYSFDLASVPLTAEALRAVDAVVLTTDHARFDYDLIRAEAPLIIDSRGVFREAADHIHKA